MLEKLLQCGRLAKRATGRNATDRTKYGTARGSTKSFYTHHTQRLSKAAVIGDAASICEAITAKKQQACAKAMGVPAAGAGCVGSPITAGGAWA